MVTLDAARAEVRKQWGMLPGILEALGISYQTGEYKKEFVKECEASWWRGRRRALAAEQAATQATAAPLPSAEDGAGEVDVRDEEMKEVVAAKEQAQAEGG